MRKVIVMEERVLPHAFKSHLEKEVNEISEHFPEVDISFRKKLLDFSQKTLENRDEAWIWIHANVVNQTTIVRQLDFHQEEMSRAWFLQYILNQMKMWKPEFGRCHESEKKEYLFYYTLAEYILNYIFLKKLKMAER